MRTATAVLLALGLPGLAHAQIAGRVVAADSSGSLPGVTVRVVETGAGTGTGPGGAFRFDGLRAGTYTLRASRIGFASADVRVAVQDGRPSRVEIALVSAELRLAEVLAEVDRPRSAASSESVQAFDLLTRPTASAQDLLRLVPGLITAQHAGGGKAEQIFLRGFDADHGTDVAVHVDGAPVNMVSHGHGQGYADLHFVIPETVERMDVSKGPYHADDGDFATAGSVRFATRDRLDASLVRVRGGSFGAFETTALVGLPGGGTSDAYAAAQVVRTDGPFAASQDFHRVNLFGKATRSLASGAVVRASAGGFASAWNASGQVPERAIAQGAITRFGALDAGEGGATSREDVRVAYDDGPLHLDAYGIRYRFKLFSNFTFFLNDPVNGDMIEQTDRRVVAGANVRYARAHALGTRTGTFTLGGTLRSDAGAVALYQSPGRVRGAVLVDSRVDERALGLFAEEDLALSPRLRVVAGLRADYFTFDVDDALDGQASAAVHASGVSQALLVSPKATVVFSPTDALDVFVNAGTGFHSNDARAAVYADRLRRAPGGVSAEDLAASRQAALPRAFAGELGARARVLGRLTLAAALWRLDLDEEYVYVGDAGTTEPSGRSRRVGIDLEARGALLPWLVADLDVNLSRGILVDEPEGANAVPLAPRLTSTGGLTAQRTDGLSASLRYVHVGDRPANEDGSVRALGYTVVTLGGAYRWRALELSAVVENLLDVDWNEAQFDTESRLRSEAVSVSELHFTPGNPRGVRLGLACRF